MPPRSAFSLTGDVSIHTSAPQNHGRSSEEIRDHVRLNATFVLLEIPISLTNSPLVLSMPCEITALLSLLRACG
jgi:hypothetical protein